MKAHFSILLIFVVIYMLFIPAAYLKYTREADSEFSALLLSKAADYAGEAAMSACISVADLEIEYATGESMIMSLDKAAYSFALTLCLSYGIPASSANLDAVINKIPVMILVAYDGYHIAQWQESDNGEFTLMWKLKRPYVVDMDLDSDTGAVYGVDLSMNHWRAVDKATLSMSEGDGYQYLPFTKETMLQQINRSINRDVTAVLRQYAVENGIPNMQSFYLPLSTNTIGVRRIEKPSLIIVMQDFELDGVNTKNLSVVNGMTVSQKRLIVAWTDGSGRRWYCYQGQADHAAQNFIEMNGELFYSMEEAAMAGYLPFQ